MIKYDNEMSEKTSINVNGHERKRYGTGTVMNVNGQERERERS